MRHKRQKWDKGTEHARLRRAEEREHSNSGRPQRIKLGQPKKSSRQTERQHLHQMDIEEPEDYVMEDDYV